MLGIVLTGFSFEYLTMNVEFLIRKKVAPRKSLREVLACVLHGRLDEYKLITCSAVDRVLL